MPGKSFMVSKKKKAVALGLGVAGLIALSRYYTASAYMANRAFLSLVFRRAVFARVYQTYPAGSPTYTWTLPSETASTVGTAIAGMKPTYVSGLIRTDHANVTLPSNVVSDYEAIRNLVLAAVPKASFDIVIRTEEYTTAAEIAADMNALVPQIPFESFYLDAGGTSTVVAGAVSAAHSLGKLVGGDTWSAPLPDLDFTASTIPSLLPVTSSILAAQGTGTGITTGSLPSAMAALVASGLPVMLHVNNFTPDRETYVSEWTQAQRISWNGQCAALQQKFSFMYGLFFPEAPIGTSYDCIADGTLSTFENLIGAWNPPPK